MSATTEQLLIGSILADEVIALDACHKIGVHEDWFTNNACRVAWLYIHQLKAKGMGIDTYILWKASKPNHGDLLAVNITSKWVDSATGPAYAGHYAELLRAEWKRSEAIKVATMLQEATKDGNPDSIIAECQHRLNELNATIDKPKTTEEVYAEIIAKYRNAALQGGSGYPTMWRDLNKILGGYHSGDGPYIIAARPGVGKSTMMINDAKFHASRGIPVSIASQEMSEHQLRARMLCEDADMSTFSLDRGNGCDFHFNKLEETAKKQVALPIRIHDQPQTISQFASWATNEVIKHGTKIIYLDYLQIVLSDGHSATRNEEISMFMREIRRLDKQFKNVVFIILSQLRRPHEGQQNERPTLRDLRDSGSIEQDAAAVIFIHEKRNAVGQSEYSLGLDKHRFGATGWVSIHFEKSRQRFVDLPEPSI